MTAPDENKTANWTIMVYIAADDTLANFAVGSLQQLIRVAGDNDGVVVTAQFDADGRRNISRLVFDSASKKNGFLPDYQEDTIPPNTDMANPNTLRNFIDWAYRRCKAEHYCLVLWGHGPELLVEDPPAGGGRRRLKHFLTPVDMKEALDSTDFHSEGHAFDVIAIDACCMSMLELACELPDYARFVIASQEDVPDFSFPYDKLLIFDRNANTSEVKQLCQEIPRRYAQAYRDYVLTQGTEMENISLSSLSLPTVNSVTGPLGRLADALLDGVRDEQRRQRVVRARKSCKGFVAGLYADLYDFCDHLQDELPLSSHDVLDEKIRSACRDICGVIGLRDEHALVLASEAQDIRCHGISIYFPYWTEPEKNANESPGASDETNTLEANGGRILESDAKVAVNENRPEAQPRGRREAIFEGGIDLLSKGNLLKGGIDLLSKEALNKSRRQRIAETEQYYSTLTLSTMTGWDKFIRHCWSRWLAEEVEARMKSANLASVSEALDQQYSAQQCAVNLLSLCRELEQKQSAGARSRD